MKKIFTISFLFFAGVLNSFAQTIPNSSFESWTPYSGGNCSPPNQYPTGWQTSDQTYCGYITSHSAAKETVDKCDSAASIKLTTVSVPIFNLAPGAATNGSFTGITLSSLKGGTPDTVRSAKLSGCYKYLPSGTDTAFIYAWLFKYDSLSGSRDTVAAAVMSATSTVSAMTNFQVDFTYKMSANPDTILILLVSSPGLGLGQSGSTLIVDNLNVNGTIGIEENSVIKNVNVYPSPASNELNIDVTYKAHRKTYFNLFDGIGKNILSGEMKNNQQKINTTSLSNGIYILSLTNESGEKLYSTKVTVSH